MVVTTTIAPGPRSPRPTGLDEAIESHPIWTEPGGPVNPNSANRYVYAAGDPVNGYDPTGMWSWSAFAKSAILSYGIGLTCAGFAVATGGVGAAVCGFAGAAIEAGVAGANG